MSYKDNALKDPLDRNICICKKVTRRTVIETVKTQNLTSMEQVREATEANTGCGACYEGVEKLLQDTLATTA